MLSLLFVHHKFRNRYQLKSKQNRYFYFLREREKKKNHGDSTHAYVINNDEKVFCCMIIWSFCASQYQSTVDQGFPSVLTKGPLMVVFYFYFKGLISNEQWVLLIARYHHMQIHEIQNNFTKSSTRWRSEARSWATAYWMRIAGLGY